MYLIAFGCVLCWSKSATCASRPCLPAGHCEGQVVLSDAAGSFTDGSSAASNIVADCDCKFLIKPAAPAGKRVTGIVVILDRVSTYYSYKTSNVYYQVDLTLYAGNATSSPAVWSRRGSSTELPNHFEVMGDSALINFRAMNGGRTTGFEARYYSLYEEVTCPQSMPLRESWGEFGELRSHGHGIDLSTPCSWVITAGQAVTLYLTDMRLPAGSSLTVYEGVDASGAMLREFVADDANPFPVVSSGTRMFLLLNTSGVEAWETVVFQAEYQAG